MKLIYSFLSLFIGLFILVPSAQAKVIVKEEDSIVIEKSEIIADDLFLAADTVDIFGNVNGDVYVSAGVVNFYGTITGDLIIGSGKVFINGQIGDDLIIGAGDITITESVIGDGLIIGAGSVTIDDESTINGSLLAGTGMLDNQAPVGRNIMIGAGTIKHNAFVGGEAYLRGETLTLGPKTVINGDLTYSSEKDLKLDDRAVIIGETIRHIPKSTNWKAKKFNVNAKLALHTMSFFAGLIVGLVMLWLFKKPVIAVAENIKSKFAATLGWGLIILLLAFPTLALIAITGVGFPLAAILGALLIIYMYIAKMFVALAIGTVLKSRFNWKKANPQVLFSLGLLVIYLLRIIPKVGAFVSLLILLSGLGGLWIYKKNLLK